MVDYGATNLHELLSAILENEINDASTVPLNSDAIEPLQIVRDALLDEVATTALIAPLHTPYYNPRVLFPFAVLPPLHATVPRSDVRLREVRIVTCVHDFRYKALPILHALENGNPFDLEKINDGRDYAVYYRDINTIVVLEGKHHIFAAKKLNLDVTLPHIPTFNLLDCGFHPTKKDGKLFWANTETDELIWEADPRVASAYTITTLLKR